MPTNGYRLPRRITLWAICLNVALFGLKYWAGYVSGSVALVADAWHTLSDSLSSVVVLVGIAVSARPPDGRHPFGHARAELIAAMLVGVLLALVGVGLLREAAARLVEQTPARFGWVAISVTILSLVAKEAMARWTLWGARVSGMESLRADAWHHRSDAISSAVILAGILSSGWAWWIDGGLGVLVALLILYTAYTVVRDAASPLLGEAPDPGLIAQLNHVCSEVAGTAVDVHHVHLHRYGAHLEVTFHLRLPAHMALASAHELTTRVEQRLRTELELEATIHMEPR